LEEQVKNLSEKFKDNEETICQLERKILEINDFEIRHLMGGKKIFDILNYEKPSKNFLNLAKVINKGDSLSVIKNDNGEEFETDNLREEYITNFYSNLYRKDEGIEGSIEDFLGEEISNSSLVQNSKLTNIKRDELDADLRIEELTKAVGESNMRSAPGIDGFSNKFILKFWEILKWPFFECCKLSLDEGSLIDSFSIAQIKIIPKKGDVTRLKTGGL
jgi:hypothetical protein